MLVAAGVSSLPPSAGFAASTKDIDGMRGCPAFATLIAGAGEEGIGTGRSSGDGFGDVALGPLKGGGGGGRFLRSDDDDEARNCRVSSGPSWVYEPPDDVLCLGLTGSNSEPFPFLLGGRLMPICVIDDVLTASCSNLERRFFTAGWGIVSISPFFILRLSPQR